MGVEVDRAGDDDLAKWDQYVSESPHGTLFHQREALDILASASGTTVHHLIGHKGQEPVGLFPIFEMRIGPVRGAFSPPPALRIPSLGPALLNMEKLSRRKTDRRQRQFVEGCLSWLSDRINPRYGHFRTNGRYTDLRPFIWNSCDVSPEYSYVVSLDRSPDDLVMTFSRDARSNVQTDDGEYTIEIGGEEAIDRIIEQVANRYEAQGVDYHIDSAFVTALYTRLPDGHIRPYTCSVDGQFVGGILVLEYGDTLYRWQGGVRADHGTDLPINDLLDWAVMTDGIERGLDEYDLVGADNPRINRYKAKFNPRLQPHHRIELGSIVARRLARLYQSYR